MRSVPKGTAVYLRLETPISTKASHQHEALTARVVRDVRTPAGILIPVGAVARGRLDEVVPSSNPAERARVRVRFTRLEIPGERSLKVVGRITEIENARESVLGDGTVQGVLASELPLTFLEQAMGKLGKGSAELEKVQEDALGKSDTSIAYPAGTDLTIVLEEPLNVDRNFPPIVRDQLPPEVTNVAEQLLSGAPRRVQAQDGAPGDPLNLIVIGNLTVIRRAFEGAGWSEAEAKTGKAIWQTVRAVAANQGYGRAPVSQLYLYGRHEDLAFEKMLNTFAKRHHLRLWRSPATTKEGREIWLGAATHDTGLDVRPGVLSHAIDSDLDSERAKVGADLAVTGRVVREQLLARPDPLCEGTTATGAPWKTDGRVLAIELKAQDER